MARKARVKSSTGVYAVSLRGNTDVFKSKLLKDCFKAVCDEYLGDGLMAIKFHNDSVEMLIKESGKGISMDMKPLTTSFARTYNRETGCEGKVFADRFKSVPVEDDETEQACMAYLTGKSTKKSVFAPKSEAIKKSEKSATAKAEPKKETVKKTAAPKKTSAPAKKAPEKKEEPKQEQPVRRQQNSLPTWLL